MEKATKLGIQQTILSQIYSNTLRQTHAKPEYKRKAYKRFQEVHFERSETKTRKKPNTIRRKNKTYLYITLKW